MFLIKEPRVSHFLCDGTTIKLCVCVCENVAAFMNKCMNLSMHLTSRFTWYFINVKCIHIIQSAARLFNFRPKWGKWKHPLALLSLHDRILNRWLLSTTLFVSALILWFHRFFIRVLVFSWYALYVDQVYTLYIFHQRINGFSC